MTLFMKNTNKSMKNLAVKADVVGYEDFYQVSSDGEVYTKGRVVRGGNNIRTMAKRMLKKRINDKGYYTINLYDKDGVIKTKRVHRLLYESFIGKIPDGSVIHHRNGNSLDNSLENLKCVAKDVHSSIENIKVGYDIGEYIRWIYETGQVTQQRLAEMFNTSDSTIGAIILKQRTYDV